MRDDQRRQRLTDASPWWRAAAGEQDPAAWTGHHPVLKERAAHDLGFRAGVLDDLQSGPVTDHPCLIDWEYTRLGDPANEMAYAFDQNTLTPSQRRAFWDGYQQGTDNRSRLTRIIERVE